MKDKRNEDLVHLKIKCRDNKTIAALLFLNQETKKKNSLPKYLSIQ
jgi:hypothetical protein